MANILTAGNSSNGGTAISTDTSGTLNIVTGSGSGANAITIDASQVVTIPGNLTVSGTLSASGGVSGGIRSGTAVASTSGTSIDFTSLPTGLKRITVMFSGVSTNGSSNILVQLGDSGGVEATSYISISGYSGATNAAGAINATTGFVVNVGSVATTTFYGALTLFLQTGTTWVESHAFGITQGATLYSVHGGGNKSLSDVLDRVRITTVNGTDAFDAGSINILYE
jgi:hypothetical protein